jgi:glycosyltransferase involved in cell wall biosynthesis
MENKPLVSIVIANYNSDKYINDTLNSLYVQTYDNIEIIVADDCSMDNSVNIINSWTSQKLKNLVFIRNKENLGGGVTKLVGLERASGEIVGFVDCDDYLHERAVEKMVEVHMSFEKVGLVYSNAVQIDASGQIKGLLNKSKKLKAGQTILDEDCAFHFATWKREYYELCTDGFSSKFNIAYDLDLFYKLEEVSEVIYIDEPLYYYRIHGNNLSIGLNKLGSSISELLVAKFEAQSRRRQIDITKLGVLLQSTYDSVYSKGRNSVGIKQLIKDRIRKYL